MMFKYFLTMLSILFIIGCSREASHLPSIFELPGAIVTHGIENSIYTHKRKKVKKYILLHYSQLEQEIKNGKGKHLETLLHLADLKHSEYPDVIYTLQKDHQNMFKNILLSTEAVMNTFSSLYPPKEKTKTVHGFTYSEASSVITDFLKKDFDIFRKSLHQKNDEGLLPLAKKLHITQPEKRSLFYHRLWQRYDDLIIEPVVVGIMIHSG